MKTKIAFPKLDLLEVITVGFPFCGFKIISGLSFSHPAGYLLVGLGILDLLMNSVNLVSLTFLRRRTLRTCVLELLFNLKSTRPDLGNSADVLVSFTLVAVMIGGGFIKNMTPLLLTIWNFCVVFNVMGAGLTRFGSSLKSLSFSPVE